MGKFGSTSGTYLSVRAKARAMYGFAKRSKEDARGVTRHVAGSIEDTLFGYLPVSPTPGIVCVDTEVWNFQTPIDVLVNADSPRIYMWEESAWVPGSTRLSLVDTPGGACKFTTGPNDGDTLMYQAPVGAASFDTAFWLSVDMQMDKALSGGFYIGLSDKDGNPLWPNPIGVSGNDVDSVGIGTIPTYVDLLKRIRHEGFPVQWVYLETEHGMMSNVRVELGIKWVPKELLYGEWGGTVYFYRNNKLLDKQALTSAEKPQGGLRVSFAGITGYDGEVTFQFHRIILITAHPAVCEDKGT